MYRLQRWPSWFYSGWSIALLEFGWQVSDGFLRNLRSVIVALLDRGANQDRCVLRLSQTGGNFVKHNSRLSVLGFEAQHLSQGLLGILPAVQVKVCVAQSVIRVAERRIEVNCYFERRSCLWEQATAAIFNTVLVVFFRAI